MLLRALEEQFGIAELPVGVFVQNAKGKVYVVNRDVERVPYESLFIDALGLYLGGWQADGFRLSMEGSQPLAGSATRGFFVVDDDGRHAWLRGEDLPCALEGSSFLIVVHGRTGDVLGSGKVRQPREGERGGALVVNFVPKARRLVVVNA